MLDMKRYKLQELQNWKKNKFRKPLIVRGARQTGKTWLLKEFGKIAFEQTVYVNFEETPNLQSLFVNDFDIQRIITTLQIHTQITVDPENTLIIFDEIQSAEKGITSLKYFQENAPEYFLIAAGSLLGMGLHSNFSFPVGKVEFLDLRPMAFTEFLSAINEEGLADMILKKQWDVLSVFHDKLNELLRYYFYVGGMPEVVGIFAETRNWELVRKTQNQILHSYEGDFSKHAPAETVPRIRMVWQSIPAHLAKENKKFVLGILREGARAKDFELAIQWLVDSGLLLKSHRVTKPNLPLMAYHELSVFKLFLHDVGLLGAMTGLNVRTLIEGDSIFTEFKGAITEQFVMQQLRLESDRYIAYWTNDRSTAEVDFVVQDKGEVIPIEVKSGENLQSKSFRFFCDKFKPKNAYRASPAPFKTEDWMTNIPLYGIF
jgi:predicted AAA+ superfamily ATPase